MSKSIPPVKSVPGERGFNDAAAGGRGQDGRLQQDVPRDAADWQKALAKARAEGGAGKPDVKFS